MEGSNQEFFVCQLWVRDPLLLSISMSKKIGLPGSIHRIAALFQTLSFPSKRKSERDSLVADLHKMGFHSTASPLVYDLLFKSLVFPFHMNTFLFGTKVIH